MRSQTEIGEDSEAMTSDVGCYYREELGKDPEGRNKTEWEHYVLWVRAQQEAPKMSE